MPKEALATLLLKLLCTSSMDQDIYLYQLTIQFTKGNLLKSIDQETILIRRLFELICCVASEY